MSIYLDNGATTALAQEVFEAMGPWLVGGQVGNPSSSHRLGLAASRAVKTARSQVAEALGCTAEEVVFTSGGTEADALAVLGVCRRRRAPGHLVVSAIEHPAVLEAAKQLSTDGWDVHIEPVDTQGYVNPQALAAQVRSDTALVSVMHVNNEIGTVQPIAQIARAVKAKNPNTVVHTDAVQSFTKEPTDVLSLGIDLLSLSGHKFHGPMGVGALYVRQGVALQAMLVGGAQEEGRRSGTLNVPGIVGLGAAARLGATHLRANRERLRGLRDQLWELLEARISGLSLNGPSLNERVCHNLHISIPGCASGSLLHAMEADEVYASAGSACHSRNQRLSHVLEAIGLKAEGAAHLRLTLSKDTTEADVSGGAAALISAVATLR